MHRCMVVRMSDTKYSCVTITLSFIFLALLGMPHARRIAASSADLGLDYTRGKHRHDHELATLLDILPGVDKVLLSLVVGPLVAVALNDGSHGSMRKFTSNAPRLMRMAALPVLGMMASSEASFSCDCDRAL